MSARGHRLHQHAVLDRLDLLLDRLEHRHVVVDDEVEDGVEDEVLALGQRGRAALPMLAHGGVGGRGAVPDADDVALAEEEMGLAEGDAAVDQLRGARDDEQRVAILLELGALVGVLGVLDGEVVQVELRAARGAAARRSAPGGRSRRHGLPCATRRPRPRWRRRPRAGRCGRRPPRRRRPRALPAAQRAIPPPALRSTASSSTPRSLIEISSRPSGCCPGCLPRSQAGAG